MARQTVSPDERREAITLIPESEAAPTFGNDADTEQAWNGWFEAIQNSESQGKIRVAKVPTNEDGAPNLTSKGQIQLLAVPHDQYNFDELCNVIRKDFMEPGETMCVRIMGFREGVKGFEFNRIMMLKRSKSQAPQEQANSQLGEILRAMQASQESNATLMREMLTPREVVPKTSAMEMFAQVAGIIGPIAGPIIAAWVAKPSAKPTNDLSTMIDAMMKLKDITTGNTQNENGDDNSMLGIVKAVAPAGLQLLNTLASQQRQGHNQVGQIPVARQVPRLPAATTPGANSVPSATVSTNDVVQTNMPIQQYTTDEQEREIHTPTEAPPMIAKLKEMLGELVTLCDAKQTPADVAELTLSMLPEEYDDPLFELVSDENKFAKLKMLNAGIATPERAPWFEQLRQELFNRMAEPVEPPAPPTSQTKQ